MDNELAKFFIFLMGTAAFFMVVAGGVGSLVEYSPTPEFVDHRAPVELCAASCGEPGMQMYDGQTDVCRCQSK